MNTVDFLQPKFEEKPKYILKIEDDGGSNIKYIGVHHSERPSRIDAPGNRFMKFELCIIYFMK